MMTDIERARIHRANQLGAQGYRVIDIIEPQDATQDQRGIFIVEKPEQSASDKVWHEN